MKNCFFKNWYCISQIHDLKPIIERSFDNQRSPNVTLHMNKKHVLFQVESSEEILKTIFKVTTKEVSRAELKQTFSERTQRRFGKFVFSFQWNRPFFFGRFGQKSSKQFHTLQKDEDHVLEKKSKAVFVSIRYRKISQAQDVKSQSTKPSLRKLSQPKRDSANEQKTLIVPKKETWGSSQNNLFSWNQKKQSRTQKDTFGTYSTSFWKVSVLLKKQKLFFQVFDIIRHLKRRIKRAKVPNLAFENCRSRNVTLHLNKKHVLFQVERFEEVRKTNFLVTAKETSQAELKKTFLERTKRLFWKFVFSFRWNRPIFFGRFGWKTSKQFHTLEKDEDHVSEKNHKLFL